MGALGMSNAKKICINNAIAIVVYGFTVALTIRMSYTVMAIESRAFNLYAIGFYAAVLCMVCGFFLIPIKKRTFLSILPVSIAFVVFALAYLVLSTDSYAGFLFFSLNPFFMLFFMLELEPPTELASIVFLLTPLLPSLYFYVGMLVRKLVRRIRAKNNLRIFAKTT